MSENWKINIKTDLDTKGAKDKLDAFIKENDNKKTINIKVNANSEKDLNNLKNSLKDVQKTINDTGKVKIRLDGSITDATKRLKVNVEDISRVLGNSTTDAMKRLANSSSKAVESAGNNLTKSFKQATKDADKLVTRLQKIDGKYLTDSQNTQIQKYVDTLNSISKIDVAKIDEGQLKSVQEDIENIVNEYIKLNDTAKLNKFAETFNNIKINPLIEQMESVRSVMSAKNMDLSGIDNLISRTKNIAKTATSIEEIKDSYARLKNELTQRISVELDLSKVKNSESALKELYKYKNELANQKMKLDIDSSQIEKVNREIQKTDEIIAEVESRLGTVGKSTNLNLIDSSTNKQVEDFSNNLEKATKEFKNLKAEADKLHKSEFVDISQLASLDHYVQGMESSLKMLNGNISSNGIEKFNSDIKILKSTIESVKKSAETLKIEAKFDVDVGDTEARINGIYAAMEKMGNINTSKINEWKTVLESIKGWEKVDLGNAVAQLGKLNSEMNEFANSNGIKNATGDMKQYIQYAKELGTTMKNSLNAKDSNIASSYESQAKRIESAMDRLKSSFKEAEQSSADAFKSESFTSYANKFTSEAEKIDNQINKLKSSLANLDKSVDFNSLNTDFGKGLAEQFNAIMSKADELKEKLKNALSSNTFDLEGINKIKSELEQVESQANDLKKLTITFECANAVSDLNELETKMKELGQDTSKLDNLRNAFITLGTNISEARIDTEQAVKEFASLSSQVDKLESSFKSAGSSAGNFGAKIQGFFQSIKQSFSQFTIGELMADGIQQGIYSIKEIITEFDDALANFARVAPDNFTVNSSNLESVAQTAKQIAIDVGQSTSDVINAMSTALQAGAKTMEQATAIAKSSAIFQNVTDMSAESASQAVATLINQYYSMDTALSQVDKGVGATVSGYNNLTEAMDLVR